MKTAVCLKQVPSRDAPLSIAPGSAWIREPEAQFETNEADLHALEEALSLRDQRGGEVVIVSVGPARVAKCLRDGLAKGADSAIHVLDENSSVRDPIELASILNAVIAGEAFDLVLTGLQSDDKGYGQTGGMLAELLDYAHASIVTRILFEGEYLKITREQGCGWMQDVILPLPAVLTIQAGINKPRYAGMKGIMAAKRKVIKTVDVAELEHDIQQASQRQGAILLPRRDKNIELLAGTPEDVATALVERLASHLP